MEPIKQTIRSLDINLKSETEYGFCSRPAMKTNFFINCIERSGIYLNKMCIDFSTVIPGINRSLIFYKVIQSCQNLQDITLLDGKKSKFFCDVKLSVLFSRNNNIQEIYLGSLDIRGDCLLKINPNPVKALAIFDFPKLQSNYFYDFLSKLKNLCILRIPFVFNEDIDPVKIIQALIDSECENMTKIDLVDFDFTSKIDEVLPKFLSKQKNLSYLHVAKLEATESIMNSLSSDSLESLNINFSGEFKCIDRLKNLRELLCRVDNITDESVRLLSECLKLENIYIYVKDSYSLTSTGENYFSKFQNLVTFRLLCNKCIDNVLKAVTRCQKIKNIIVSSSNLTYIGLSHISSLPNLEILEISTNNFTDKQLLDLVAKALKLKEIDITACLNITEKFLIDASKLKKKRGDSDTLQIICKFNPLIMVKIQDVENLKLPLISISL